MDINVTNYQDFNVDIGTRIKLGKATSMLSANVFHFDKLWDINGDNFTDITLQKRVSLFNKWNFRRKENRTASMAVRYVWEDRWGGELQWTPAFRGGDSIYGESIRTKRIELIGNYQLPTKEKLFFPILTTYTIKTRYMAKPNTLPNNRLASVSLRGINQ
ncbi:MAG: hypothetical protein IPP49_08280 [Saprospiraceae bacterium]|nr:hypothetical protein [Saprospiraceae bacterium]